jgi:hypothetical protein
MRSRSAAASLSPFPEPTNFRSKYNATACGTRAASGFGQKSSDIRMPRMLSDPLGDSPPKDEPQFGAGLAKPSGRTRCRDPVGSSAETPNLSVSSRHAASGPDQWGPEVVPEGTYFVMGDRRDNSSDSRHWGFVPREYVLGRVTVRWWPLSARRRV